jgi:hypothetical protein
MVKHRQRTPAAEHDPFRDDVKHALAVVTERARDLETAGRTVFDGILDATFDDAADELRDRASRVRAGARSAVAIAFELESMAGRLDGLATARLLTALDGAAPHRAVPQRSPLDR